MQFSLDTRSLKLSLDKIINTTERRNINPVLNCLHFLGKENELKITGTDLEIGGQVSLALNSNENFNFCLNARHFYQIINEINSQEIHLEIIQDRVVIKASRFSCEMVTLNAGNFPHVYFSMKDPIKVSTQGLIELINYTDEAIAKDDVRTFLQGLFLQNFDNKLRAVATNGFKLALFDLESELTNSSILKEGILIPKKALGEIKKVVGQNQSIEMAIDDSFLIIKSDNCTLSIRLIANNFFDYTSVIPKKLSFEAPLIKNDLINALKKIRIFSHEKVQGSIFTFADNQLKIESDQSSLGHACEVVTTNFNEHPFQVKFNANTLLEILGNLEQDELTLHFSNPVSPFILKEVNKNHCFNMIMPLKM